MCECQSNGASGSLGDLRVTGGRLARPFALASLLLVRGYQFLVSPLLGPACRFTPSCSEYAIICLRTHPLPRAYWLIARRLVRCHPWGGQGYDPVPERASACESPGEGAHICLKCSLAASSVISSASQGNGDRCGMGEAPRELASGSSDVGSSPL